MDTLLAESTAKDRDIQILKKRLLFDTNDLNLLNTEIEAITRRYRLDHNKSSLVLHEEEDDDDSDTNNVNLLLLML